MGDEGKGDERKEANSAEKKKKKNLFPFTKKKKKKKKKKKFFLFSFSFRSFISLISPPLKMVSVLIAPLL